MAPWVRERDDMGHRPGTIIGATITRRWAVDVLMLAVMGLLLGFLGPFDSDSAPLATRYAYWTICMVGGGLIAIAVDEGVGRRLPVLWRRLAVTCALATPPVTLFVVVTQHLMFAERRWSIYLPLLWQVGPIMLAAMTVRALAWRRRPMRIQTRTVVEPPLPQAEATFRRRLSAKRRGARLIAIEAHDHYLRVHTDAGPELIALRFADALDELSRAHGWQVHRSWWVAADAVEAVRWRRGTGEMRLVGGLTAPVSRTHGPALKAAGWL